METNVLYYGDNLTILHDYIPSESIDLVYLDPPFNSNRSYNVLFKEATGAGSAAQIEAFEDTWNWQGAATTYQEILTKARPHVSSMLRALVDGVGHNDVTAYLTMMTIRLEELRRVLKPTGSLYLHCDPTASHYLKIVMDTIFGPKNYINEITWKRTSAHSDTAQGMRRYGKIRDVLLFYTRSANRTHTWNPIYQDYTKQYLQSEYRHLTTDGRPYKETDVTAAKPGGDTQYDWHVKRRENKGARWEADLDHEQLSPKSGWEYRAVHPYKGRYWAFSKDNLVNYAKDNRLTHRKTGMPRLMHFADDMPGIPLQDLWDDIPPAAGAEALGYRTQKPLALLKRIVKASSNEGDVVLDPFCGCGTAVHAAHSLGRRWIGIDITWLAIALVKRRMEAAFPGITIEEIGSPADLVGAKALAAAKPQQFEYWLINRLDGIPTGGKGPDLDGVKPFVEFGGAIRAAIVSVKGTTAVNPEMVREVLGALSEHRPIGVLATLTNPTKGMHTLAAAAGFYESAGKNYPRMQLISVEEMFKGKRIDLPTPTPTFAQPAQEPQAHGTQPKLELPD